MEKHMKAMKIPYTDSISELAEFWDSHDLTDFEDELEDVYETVFERPPEETLTIHLPAREAEVVKRMAQAEGIGQSALIRKWLLEKLDRV
jgi:predicted DNA binding CopG/RHH family protein